MQNQLKNSRSSRKRSVRKSVDTVDLMKSSSALGLKKENKEPLRNLKAKLGSKTLRGHFRSFSDNKTGSNKRLPKPT